MKVLVRGPALTRTGYGEHCRFVLRALRQVQDIDLFLIPVNWGQSSWVWDLGMSSFHLSCLADLGHPFHPSTPPACLFDFNQSCYRCRF